MPAIGLLTSVSRAAESGEGLGRVVQAGSGWPFNRNVAGIETPLEKCRRETAGQDWLVDPCAYLANGETGCIAPNLWTRRGCVPPSLPPEPAPVPVPVTPPAAGEPGWSIFGESVGSGDSFDKLRAVYAFVIAHPYIFGGAGLVLGYLIYSYFTARKGKR